MSVIKMTDLDLAGKRVFIRADLNVPVKDGKVTSDARIRASLPTIELVELVMKHVNKSLLICVNWNLSSLMLATTINFEL